MGASKDLFKHGVRHSGRGIEVGTHDEEEEALTRRRRLRATARSVFISPALFGKLAAGSSRMHMAGASLEESFNNNLGLVVAAAAQYSMTIKREAWQADKN